MHETKLHPRSRPVLSHCEKIIQNSYLSKIRKNVATMVAPPPRPSYNIVLFEMLPASGHPFPPEEGGNFDTCSSIPYFVLNNFGYQVSRIQYQISRIPVRPGHPGGQYPRPTGSSGRAVSGIGTKKPCPRSREQGF